MATMLFEADALELPLAANSLDAITIAFGFRNLVNYRAGLAEFARVLKPGGVLAILEFSHPPWFSAAARLWILFEGGAAIDWRAGIGVARGLYVFARIGGEISAGGGTSRDVRRERIGECQV
jgi:ubiquinone/menaquinone biosynthesis C-methylase UbiE